jgi:hypothetical protein
MIILCDFIICCNILRHSYRACSYNQYINHQVYLNTIHDMYQTPTLFDKRLQSSGSVGDEIPRLACWTCISSF